MADQTSYTYTRTVNVQPLGSSYTWTNPASSWITITQQGTSDSWNIEIANNTSNTSRSATLTVTHEDGVTSDSINVNQAGVANNPTPVVTATPTPTPTATSTGTLLVKSSGNLVTSYSLDDQQGGAAGSGSVTFSYEYSGIFDNAVPVVVSKDNRVNVSFNHGTFVGGTTYGSIIITSNDSGACPASGLVLNNLVISRPDDSNVTYTLTGNLTQYSTCTDSGNGTTDTRDNA